MTPIAIDRSKDAERQDCLHCGNLCDATAVVENEKPFCCRGCSRVYALLHEEGLEAFYQLRDGERIQPAAESESGRYDVLDLPAVASQVLDHQQGNLCRVTCRIPAIHCTGCVWLLENLYSLFDGFGRTEVDILRKEARIEFNADIITLAEVADELDRLGYPPDISMASTQSDSRVTSPDRLTLKIGIAGFAFGNIMLMAFPTYLGLDLASHPTLSSLFNTLSIILTLPVMIFSASEFWKNSWRGLQHQKLSIDTPIVLGILALFGQSLYDILSGQGLGYLDSLSGLIFFLLIGKWYQRRTTDALSFDRDYQSYFPLLAHQLDGTNEHPTPIHELAPGDRIRIRHQELIPADCILLNGHGLIDYSFVTGEAELTPHSSGDHIYAGGRQCGGLLEAEIIKPVSQSYLTSLWNHSAFQKDENRISSITDKISQYFTPTVITLAFATLIFWLQQNPAAALPSMVAILIVACPCALALSAPFAFGQAMRILGKQGMYLRSADVVDHLGNISHPLFDKTGTLTEKSTGGIHYEGTPFTTEEQQWVRAAAQASTHPLCQRIASSLRDISPQAPLSQFEETSGEGIQAEVHDHVIRMGSADFLSRHDVHGLDVTAARGSHVYVAIDHHVKGCFILTSLPRKGITDLFKQLKETYSLHLLTGDHAGGTEVLSPLFPFCERILSSQSPHDKLAAVTDLQKHSQVAMIGDGLNDAGALQQSNVGISVTDNIQAFVPACDAILAAENLSRLPNFLAFAKAARIVVCVSFTLSILYNLIGFSLAATHHLTPVAAAILMPLSSITIVSIATLGTRLAAKRTGVTA